MPLVSRGMSKAACGEWRCINTWQVEAIDHFVPHAGRRAEVCAIELESCARCGGWTAVHC